METAMTRHERIEINPEVMGGKPVIRGTRVPVETVLRKVGAGMTAEAILADHPRLTLDDIQAAQAFAPIRATAPRRRARTIADGRHDRGGAGQSRRARRARVETLATLARSIDAHVESR